MTLRASSFSEIPLLLLFNIIHFFSDHHSPGGGRVNGGKTFQKHQEKSKKWSSRMVKNIHNFSSNLTWLCLDLCSCGWSRQSFEIFCSDSNEHLWPILLMLYDWNYDASHRTDWNVRRYSLHLRLQCLCNMGQYPRGHREVNITKLFNRKSGKSRFPP